MNRTLVMRLWKWAVWLSVFGVLFLLRALFPALFLTFILAYMGNTSVNAMTKRFPQRRLNLVIFYVAMLAVLAGTLTIVVPRLLLEASGLARQIITTGVEQDEAEHQEGGVSPQPDSDEDTPPTQSLLGRELSTVLDRQLIDLVGEETFENFSRSDTYRSMIQQIESNVGRIGPAVADGVRDFINGLVDVTFQFALSIILSFLVIWDLPRIRDGVTSLEHGRMGDVYREIAPGMGAFGIVLGRAFEAQTVVALVNTVLSTVAFLILGIPSIALLGTIVFFCSYIPVVGMLLSTLPAAILAFKTGGFALVLWLILAVAIIHAIEAYALNPLIYGRHLKMHPLLVLVVLLTAEHVVGVWGLLLGVPVAAFVLKFVIRGENLDLDAAPAGE